MLLVFAVADTAEGFAKGDGLLVEIQDGVRVLSLLGGVEPGVVGIHIDPGAFTGGKAGVGGIVPLHRGPGGVPGGAPQLLDPFFLRKLAEIVVILVDGLDIPVLLNGLRLPVQHTDLLTLIDEGGALLEQVGGCQHLAAFFPEFLAAVAGNDSGMVVVFDVQQVPCLTAQLVLPAGEGILQPHQREGQGHKVREQAVGALTLELNHGVDLAAILGDVFQGQFGGNHGCFGHGEAVVVVQHIRLKFVKVLVDMGTVVIQGQTLGGGHHMVIRQTLGLGNEGDDIFPEAVHTHIQPELQNLLHFFPDQGIVHVQVRLFDSEQVQIVLLPHLVPLPGLALEHGVPVVGELAAGLSGPPDVVVGVGVDPLTGFLEPFVLVAGVVDHQVHQHLHAPLMGTVQHFFEGFHAAEFRGDVHVVGNVIAAVCAGGGIDGGEPDAVHTQLLQVVQFFVDTPQVAHAVTVAVLETPGPDLVEYFVLIPTGLFHNHSLLFGFFHHITSVLPRHLKSH